MQVAVPKLVGASGGWGGLGESRVHKSRLEQEKEEAAQRGGGAQAPVRRVSRPVSAPLPPHAAPMPTDTVTAADSDMCCAVPWLHLSRTRLSHEVWAMNA